ncbi:copper amine oxidase N-terminal domain-containing protein [Fusibacter ferrireducens]|uniref:Copper amine oxidase N-terminal domain-containing protein n=1 Tax=Fusibacter ferrireducens TaxID=2785058 RepID=A0ABR9ZV14_9FIRM|nr:copper amine oxidase N-terminal domain-containing protein [Fusibacter ferrireducens]MBF4694303.1 copper amine oxidase N-terminal domain-containing protein [Fusibacter ferrireducens]
MRKRIILVLTGLIIVSQSMLTFADANVVEGVDSVTSATLEDELDTYKVFYLDEKIALEEPVKWIDGILMIPVKPVLDQIGFDVKWHAKTKSVDLIKGAQFTSLYIDKNSYFRNKMAPHTLSHAPVINQNRTYVPIEFFTDILEVGLNIEDKSINFSDRKMAIYEGYIQDTQVDEKGMLTITISSKAKSDGPEDQVIVHGETDSTFINTSIALGDYIHVISPPIMTFTVPGQATAYVIY